MEPAVLRLGEQIGGQTVFQRKQQVVGGAEGIHTTMRASRREA